MNGVTVSTRNLKFSFRKGEPLLQGVNLHCLQGQILIIAGLSGHGKSTLLRLLLGLERPDSGVVRLFGRDIATLSQDEFDTLKTKCGYVFQNSALLSDRTVWENVALPLLYHTHYSEIEIREQVDSTLDMLLIREYQDHYPASLSLGIQKRAAVARAIIMRPELILLDEPTAGLDRISRGILLALIANICVINHSSMVIVTHDLQVAKELGGEVGVLKDGTLLEPMGYEQLKDCQDTFVESLFQEMEQE